MKKSLLLLLATCLFFSCSKKSDVCTISGRYASAPDGTVLYLTSVDDVVNPLDSAVVRGGKFVFSLSDTVRAVRFISSQQVLDGGFVVVEPGVVKVDFAGETFVSGTASNDRLSRFMNEKGKIVNLKRLGEQEVLDMMVVEESMRDSIKNVVMFASDVFEAYALHEIGENISSPLGCFCLLQSVGVVTPAKLLPFFKEIPVEYRGALYNAVRSRVETEVRNAAIAGVYLDEIWKSREATAVGKKFQNFELDNVDGGTVLLSNEVFTNRYTLLLFWAGWQGDSRDYLPVLSAAYDKYRNKGLQIVGVSLDDNVKECRELVDELGVTWVQLCNPAGGSAEVAAAYGITELPAAVLVNKKGTIISRMETVGEIMHKFEDLF